MPLDLPPHIDKAIGIEIVADTAPCKIVREEGDRIKLVARCPGYTDIVILDIDKKIEAQAVKPLVIIQMDLPINQLPTLDNGRGQ